VSDKPWRVAVAVATFRRNDLLTALLDSLAVASQQHPLRVIVVDNDPTGPAAEVVRRPDLEIDYAIEPEPGIASARNRSLSMLRDDDDAIVFVDDDEVVDPDWLRELVTAARQHGADVVSGPVITVFPSDTPRWIVDGGYIQRPDRPSGTPIEIAATNNTLVTTDVLARAGHPRFDLTFSATGGSDTEFFWRLHRLPARMVWCATALVREEHPVDRTSRRWVWRRGVRIANVRGRLLLRERSRASVLSEGVVRVLHGLLLLLVTAIRTRKVRYPELNRVTHGVGLVGAVTGRHVQEYRR
jgi:succinoglycan biosynthesis protein ExoM